MNRGQIFVKGNVGKGLGENMRRGTIWVGGDADDLTGWNMLAGTIWVNGNAGRHCGAGMVRGTILCNGGSELLPTFQIGNLETQPTWLCVLVNWLKGEQLPVTLSPCYQVFHGDQLYGGRGEVLLGAQ